MKKLFRVYVAFECSQEVELDVDENGAVDFSEAIESVEWDWNNAQRMDEHCEVLTIDEDGDTRDDIPVLFR